MSSTFRNPDSSPPIVETRHRPIDGKPELGPSKGSKLTPTHLRTQIAIKCADVNEISPEVFWEKHKDMTASHGAGDIASVTMIAGSLSRDRIEEKSCALYECP